MVDKNCSEHVNPLNAKLNPICHLLALLGAHHILHFSRIRVNKDRREKFFVPINVFSCRPKPTAFETLLFMFSDNKKNPGTYYCCGTRDVAVSIPDVVIGIFH
jgi:hypothetical protein